MVNASGSSVRNGSSRPTYSFVEIFLPNSQYPEPRPDTCMNINVAAFTVSEISQLIHADPTLEDLTSNCSFAAASQSPNSTGQLDVNSLLMDPFFQYPKETSFNAYPNRADPV